MAQLFETSLTMAQLKEIQARRSGDDVLALLWEIKRLHVVLRRAAQLANLANSSTSQGMLLNALREELKYFSVLAEWQAERTAMLKVEKETYTEKMKRKYGATFEADADPNKVLGNWGDDECR